MGGSHESKYVSNPAIKINTQGSSSQFSIFFSTRLVSAGEKRQTIQQLIIKHFVLIPGGAFFLSE